MQNINSKLSGVAVLSLLSCANSFAQEDSTSGLEFIEVTAERRKASVQETAITLDVLSGNTIQERGVVDLEGITNLVPALHFNKDIIYTSFTLRGVGSANANNVLGDNSITVAIDGEYINRPVAINTAMYDLERVEVLRGPQGTLYGKNATAGAINLVVNRPELDTLSSSVNVEIGAFNNQVIGGTINVGVSDDIAVRAAVNVNRRDGYRDAGPAGEVDDANTDAARLGLLYKPSDDSSVYIAAEYGKVDQTAPSRFGVGLAGQVPAEQAPESFTIDVPNEWPQGFAGKLLIDQYAFRAEVSKTFTLFNLDYLASYRDVEVTAFQPMNGFIPSLFNQDIANDIQTLNMELRLSNKYDAFYWQAGLFYGDEDQDFENGIILVPVNNAWLNYFKRDVKNKTSAVFAEATRHLTEALDITIGGRYTKDEKTRIGQDLIAPGNVLGIAGYPTAPQLDDLFRPTPGPSSAKWNESTWHFGANYHLNAKQMLFAKASKGYKAGGFDAVGQYNPEILIAYEIGAKNDLLDNSLRLNLSAFHYDYTDQQVAVLRDISIGFQTENVGETSINGIELSANYLLTDNDQVDISVNYLDASYDTFPTTQALVLADASTFASEDEYLNASVVNLAGNTPPQSPEWTIGLGYKHFWQLDSAEITFALNSQFKSSFYLTPFNWSAGHQDSFTKTSARLTYQTDNWRIAAFVNNIEDEQDLIYANFTGGPRVSIYNFAKNAPRTYGLQFTYNWD